MTLHDLKAKFEENGADLYEFGPIASINCLKLISSSATGHSGDLFLGRTEDFVRYGVPAGVKSVVCVGDPNLILPTLESSGVNCLSIRNCPDIFGIYNDIAEQISISTQLRRGTEILFRSAGAGKRQVDIDKIIDVMGELFCNPVALFSGNGDVIAFRDLDTVYPELLNDFQFDRLSQSFLDFLGLCDLTKDQPQILGGFLGQQNLAVLGKIVLSGECVAYCVVFEHNRFNGAEASLMMLVCAWLAQEMRTGSISLSPNNTFSHKFLSGLIENRISSDEIIAQSLHNMSLDKAPYYYVMVVDLTALDICHGSPRSIGDMLQHRLRNGITSIYDNYLVALLNTDKGFAKDAFSGSWLNAFLKSLNVVAGISYCFSSVKDVPSAYRQALRAISIGRVFDSMGCLFFYSDSVIYDLINTCGQHEDTMPYCLPQLLELIEHDRLYNTQYAYTLYILIISGGKQTMAAKALGIHRTTMQYRVEKIIEKTGMDIYDMYNIIRLYLSFGILLQNGRLDPETYYQL